MVFNIQRYSIHDGPGIRTTVFFKGCPLRCRWCSNPESQRREPQIILHDARCTKCGACAAACPAEAITVTPEGRRVDWERCTQCLECAGACPNGALERCGSVMSVMDVADEAERDRVFYKNSGGGVTVSGGEPLFQPGFLLPLLRELKRRDLHVALDTTGFASPDLVEEMLPFLDLTLLDIKHMDDGIHRRHTGVSNGIILSNARLMALRTNLWVRVPLIADVNDSIGNVKSTALFAKELNAEKISLLPYHEGGISKSAQTGMTYAALHASTPLAEHVEALKEIITGTGIHVTIAN